MKSLTGEERLFYSKVRADKRGAVTGAVAMTQPPEPTTDDPDLLREQLIEAQSIIERLQEEAADQRARAAHLARQLARLKQGLAGPG